MVKRAESNRPGLGDITFKPLLVRMPEATPDAVSERRDDTSRAALVRRIRDEFEEMPGLSLTLSQASRLFGLQSEACARILRQLNEEGVVRVRSDGRYVFRTQAA